MALNGDSLQREMSKVWLDHPGLAVKEAFEKLATEYLCPIGAVNKRGPFEP